MTSTKINRKQAFLKAYKKSLFNISEACRAIGIDRKTYYNWIEKYPKFKEELELTEQQMDDIAETSLYKNVKKGLQKAVEFYLTNRKKDKYSNTVKNEHTGENGGPITYKEIIYSPTEEDKCQK